jgi:hypothetical protein
MATSVLLGAATRAKIVLIWGKQHYTSSTAKQVLDPFAFKSQRREKIESKCAPLCGSSSGNTAPVVLGYRFAALPCRLASVAWIEPNRSHPRKLCLRLLNRLGDLDTISQIAIAPAVLQALTRQRLLAIPAC